MSVTELEPSPPAVIPRQGSRDAAIRTEGLSKRYGNTHALDRLDLTVGRGEVYGYPGPNGSGKTTTIRLLLGLHHPTTGGAELFGHDAWRDPVTAHRHVACVAGESFLWPGLTSAETPFIHIGLVPAQPFRTSDAAIMLAIAAASALLAAWIFTRRDLTGP